MREISRPEVLALAFRSIRLQHQQSVHQAFNVLDSEHRNDHRQASPVDATHAIARELPGPPRQLVFGCGHGQRFALIDDAVLYVDEGSEFFASAWMENRCLDSVSKMATATA